MQPIDLWVSIGSTYSYLTIARLSAVEQATGAQVRLRPFNVREIMLEQNNIPFKDKPVKTAYMWRDIARRAARHALSPRLPAPYPLPDLPFANQVAVLGMSEGWGRGYIEAAYRLWFEEGARPGEEPALSAALARAGVDAAQALRRARTPEAETRLAEETAQARALGVFGSPSFVVAGELFWGDDRLEEAIDWAAGRHPPPG